MTIIGIVALVLVALATHVQMVRLAYRHGIEDIPNNFAQLAGQVFVQLILFPILWLCAIGGALQATEVDVAAKVKRFSQTRAGRRNLKIAALEQAVDEDLTIE